MYGTILLTENNGRSGEVMPHKPKELYTEADGRNRNYSTPSVARHRAKGDFTDLSEAVNARKGKWESVQSKRLLMARYEVQI